MDISFWTYGAIGLVLYFGWALVDPATVQEVEDHLARKSSSARYGLWSHRARNGLGLVIGLLLLIFTLSQNSPREPSPIRQPAQASAPVLPPTTAAQSQSLLDRIERATLQKQIEHQQEMSRYSESPTADGS